MLTKCKLNSIEGLMSQALTDLDISHEEFVGEKEKYDQMKESIRNKKDGDEFSENTQDYKKMFFYFAYIKWLLLLFKLMQKREFTQ